MRTGAPSWTVTTWNVRGSDKPSIDALAESITVESPDIVALQEVRQSQARALAATLGMRYTWALKHYPRTPLSPGAAEGLAVLTPHALDAAGHTAISEVRSTWRHQRRIAQWCLVGRPDASVCRIYNLHLSTGDAAHRRRAEAVIVTELISEHGEVPPAIVAGDFNDDTDPSIIYALPGIEQLTPPPTSPATRPFRTIDHVLLPPTSTNVTTTVPGGGPDWSLMSDHLPVTVRFNLD